jgi:hypothetical protein
VDQTRTFIRWLTLLRVIAGGTFVFMGTTHVLTGWTTAEGFQRGITGFASRDPLTWYTSVMVPIVLSNPRLFGPSSRSG